MISIPNKVPRKKRVFLGPLSRKILKLSNWEITGEFPNYKKIILIGVPHTANRDAWYALLAVLALDLKINFFGARWIFTRLPSPCLLYTSPSPRDGLLSRMPSSA